MAKATATATATKLRPLGDRVVIEPIPREDMTKSGIVLPDTAKEKPQEGKVIAVGPGKTLDDGKREAIDVKTATRSCTRSTPGPNSSWTARTSSSSARRTSWRSSRAEGAHRPPLDPDTRFLEETNWLSN